MPKLFGRECTKEQGDTMLSTLITMRNDCQSEADNHGHCMPSNEYLSLIAQIDQYTAYINFLESPCTS